MLRIGDALRASTAYVLNHSLPKIITLDGINAPDELNFTVPVNWIPASMYANALSIVVNAARCVNKTYLAGGPPDGGKTVYYVLSQSHHDYKDLTKSLIARCSTIHQDCCCCSNTRTCSDA